MNVSNLVGLDSLNVFLVVLLDIFQVQYVSHVHLTSEKSVEQPEEVLDFSAVFVTQVYL